MFLGESGRHGWAIEGNGCWQRLSNRRSPAVEAAVRHEAAGRLVAGAGAAHVAAPSFADLCQDDAAFTAWYQAALPRVYGFVYARTGGDSSLAEDITAQAFTDG